MKIRGLTLDEDTETNVSAEKFIEAVEKIGTDNEVVFKPNTYHRIRPNAFGEIISRDETRTYRAVCHKGVITYEWDVLPHGWQRILRT